MLVQLNCLLIFSTTPGDEPLGGDKVTGLDLVQCLRGQWLVIWIIIVKGLAFNTSPRSPACCNCL